MSRYPFEMPYDSVACKAPSTAGPLNSYGLKKLYFYNINSLGILSTIEHCFHQKHAEL